MARSSDGVYFELQTGAVTGFYPPFAGKSCSILRQHSVPSVPLPSVNCNFCGMGYNSTSWDAPALICAAKGLQVNIVPVD